MPGAVSECTCVSFITL